MKDKVVSTEKYQGYWVLRVHVQHSFLSSADLSRNFFLKEYKRLEMSTKSPAKLQPYVVIPSSHYLTNNIC